MWIVVQNLYNVVVAAVLVVVVVVVVVGLLLVVVMAAKSTKFIETVHLSWRLVTQHLLSYHTQVTMQLFTAVLVSSFTLSTATIRSCSIVVVFTDFSQEGKAIFVDASRESLRDRTRKWKPVYFNANLLLCGAKSVDSRRQRTQRPTRRRHKSTKMAARRPPSCYSQTVTSLPVFETFGFWQWYGSACLPASYGPKFGLFWRRRLVRPSCRLVRPFLPELEQGW